jgi:hypothetical protein
MEAPDREIVRRHVGGPDARRHRFARTCGDDASSHALLTKSWKPQTGKLLDDMWVVRMHDGTGSPAWSRRLNLAQALNAGSPAWD